MAALPLCASWFRPSGVAVASPSARPASRVTHVHSLGRRGPWPLPVRVQACTRASHFRCPKAADRDHGLEPQPKPEPERGDDEPNAEASTEIPSVDLIPSNPSYSYDIPKIQEQRKFRKTFCDAWLPREAPDMFRTEKDEISNYMIRIQSSRQNILAELSNVAMTLYVCAEAKEALDLASMVMGLAYTESSDRGTIQLFDQDTANQVIRMCAAIFCDIAKAAYLKRIEKDTVLSFLDALRGLGLFCDMLLQQRVFKLKDGPLKNIISTTMGTRSREFDKKMKSLEEQFTKSTTETTTGRINHIVIIMAVMEALSHGTKHAQSYILQIIPHWSLFA